MSNVLNLDRRDTAHLETRDEYVRKNLFGLGRQRSGNRVLLKAEHRFCIKQAICEGKDIPNKVLEDYPEYKDCRR